MCDARGQLTERPQFIRLLRAFLFALLLGHISEQRDSADQLVLLVEQGRSGDGQKHALGVWDGSTENARVSQDLLANLQSRGLRTDRSVLVILDGPKAAKGRGPVKAAKKKSRPLNKKAAKKVARKKSKSARRKK